MSISENGINLSSVVGRMLPASSILNNMGKSGFSLDKHPEIA